MTPPVATSGSRREQRHAVRFEVTITRHDRQPVLHRLRDHHSVEWIVMMMGKALHAHDMLCHDRQWLRPDCPERGRNAVGQGELAKRYLDRNLPHGGNADETTVVRILQCLSRGSC